MPNEQPERAVAQSLLAMHAAPNPDPDIANREFEALALQLARLCGQSPTGRMDAARRHRSRAYAERNELIGVLARLYESHVMPVSEGLATLTTRSVICIHSPKGLLCWVITAEEADEYFKPIPRIKENHWDRSTRAERSQRLAELTALPPPAASASLAKEAAPTSTTKKKAAPRRRTEWLSAFNE